MTIMQARTKRLNLNVKEETYKEIKNVAYKVGRKPGNLARYILEKWADDRDRNQNY